jgi:hypothetical protein
MGDFNSGDLVGTVSSDPSTSMKAGGLLSILSKLMPMGQAMTGRGGVQNPMISPGMIGQVPQMPGVPQVSGAGTGGASSMAMPGQPPRMAAPGGSPSQNPSGTPNAPGNPLFQTGFSFDNPQARNGAVAASAIQGVTQFLTQAKQKKEARTRAQAEGYMSQIHAAQQSGDQEALNLLLTDPKVVSTLEKGLDFLMPKVPGEPPPPEATGIKKFLDKLTGKQQGGTNPNGPRLPQPNTPGGVIQPRGPQSASNQQAMSDITSRAALQALQQDPTLARTMGLGTGLSGDEARSAERYQAGLALAPAEERKAFMANQSMLEKFDQENKQLLTELASREKTAAAGLSSQERQAHISAGPMYYRAKIAKDIADSQIRIRTMVANGKVGEANKVAMQTITSQINNLRSNAEKAKKDGHDDISAEFEKQATDLQGRYDQMQKSQEMNVDQIINDILNQ